MLTSLQLPRKFWETWENSLGKIDLADIRHLQRIRQKLHLELIERDKAPYWKNPKYLQAYELTYHYLNTIRNFQTLSQLNVQNEPIQSVLDYGCGLGAASFAAELYFKSKFEKFHFDKTNFTIPNSIKIKEVDRNFDVIMVSFVLNEFPFEKRKNLVAKLLKRTNKFLVILEPANQKFGKELGSIRDHFFTNVVYPCPRNQRYCPLAKKSMKDFCHQDTKIIEFKPMIRKFLEPHVPRRLSFSSLVLSTNPKFLKDKPHYRIVSGNLNQSEKKIFKKSGTYLVCGENNLTKEDGKLFRGMAVFKSRDDEDE